MKIRGLIVAAVVFFILAGILYWSEHNQPAADAAKGSADTPPVILKVDSSAITRLNLEKKDAKPIVLTKADSGEWKITEPQPLRADQSAVSGMLSTLSSLSSERVDEDKATDLKQYGLEPPGLQLDVSGTNNRMQKLIVGDDTPTGSAAYAMVSGDPRVYTIATYSKTSVDKSLNDLRDKRLLTVNPEKITRIELARKNQTIVFGRNNKNEWQILKPGPLRTDSVHAGELAQKLTDARMEVSSSDGRTAASAFAHATPLATAKVTDESGTQELQVRKSGVGKSEDIYYAKSSAIDGIYKINFDLGQALDKGVDEFRDKKLFDFGPGDPDKVELHLGSKAYLLIRSGGDWWQDGKKVDGGTVQSLISNLRDLAADKFSDSRFANPTIDVRVTSDDGKRVEKVLMAKSNDAYVAKRENDPGLFELSSTAIENLQKEVDEVKPAVGPSK